MDTLFSTSQGHTVTPQHRVEDVSSLQITFIEVAKVTTLSKFQEQNSSE
jgi:hypothetical protein